MISQKVFSSLQRSVRRLESNLQARKLHNNPPFSNSSAASVTATKPVELGDEHLWVRSSKPDVKPVVGFTVPEILRETMNGWGHLPAFVCKNTAHRSN